MNHCSDVGFVDAESECRGCHHQIEVIVSPLGKQVAALPGSRFAVKASYSLKTLFASQSVTQGFGLVDLCRVDDGWSRKLPGAFDNGIVTI